MKQCVGLRKSPETWKTYSLYTTHYQNTSANFEQTTPNQHANHDDDAVRLTNVLGTFKDRDTLEITIEAIENDINALLVYT